MCVHILYYIFHIIYYIYYLTKQAISSVFMWWHTEEVCTKINKT